VKIQAYYLLCCTSSNCNTFKTPKKSKMKIAILTCEKLPELTQNDQLLIPALAKLTLGLLHLGQQNSELERF
jgi:hypothetical protein